MSGYTPLFSSMLEGSLYGRWPYTGVWGCLLSFADAHGDIDRTPAMLAAAIGIPPKLLQKCIDDFMAPDTASRSTVLEGRRLVLIDPTRNWGWHIVNIQKYRDMASGQNQIADGRNAEKLRRYRQKLKEKKAHAHGATPPDTARHRQTPPDTDSYTNSDSYSYSNTHPNKEGGSFASGGAFAKWLKYCKAEGRPIQAHNLDALKSKFTKLGDHAAQLAAVEHSIANGYKGLFAPPRGNNGAARRAPTVSELEARERDAQH